MRTRRVWGRVCVVVVMVCGVCVCVGGVGVGSRRSIGRLASANPRPGVPLPVPNLPVTAPTPGPPHSQPRTRSGTGGWALTGALTLISTATWHTPLAQTSTLTNNESPVWNECFDFVVDDPVG